MSKRILSTICWTVILFLFLAVTRFCVDSENWLKETIDWVIPAAIGYFIGYGHGHRQKDGTR